jgi:cellulose synthase/poly-beta-1,6-N-acetylglucosamine synthase-like glycosyltransferase
VAASAGDPLLFTDADCAPTPGWAAALLAAFEDPRVAGARGTYRTRQPGLVARFVQEEYAFKYQRTRARRWIDFIDTYSAAYRREVFIRNHGFDPGMRGVEDQEFSFRLARQGYCLAFVPDAVVYHQHVDSPIAYLKRKFQIGHWKAVLLRLHPEKALGDSHTPVTQRTQLALMGLAVLSFALGPLWTPALWFGLGALALFGLSTVPFLAHIAREDPPVLWVAPGLLVGRALALGAGLVSGALNPPPAPRGRGSAPSPQ